MNPARILVAGIGNIFLGDDAFGVEVAQRLMRRPQPPGVSVVDFGIRGVDLTYALLDGCETAILIDAAPRGGTPGTLYLLEPRVDQAAHTGGFSPILEAHSMDPVKVLQAVVAMGGRPGRVLVVGCEPTPAADVDDMQMELSPPVALAIDEAVRLVESIVQRILGGEKDLTQPLTAPAEPALT